MAGPLDDAPLGEQSAYPDAYDPALLFPIARATSRDLLKLSTPLPFQGMDVWNAYEVSWLGSRGLPVVRIGSFWFDAASPYIIESKSLKLYLNSLNNTRFDSELHARDTIKKDLSAASGADVRVGLLAPELGFDSEHPLPSGWCIDDSTTEIETYNVEPELLRNSTVGEPVSATLYSDLLRSLCPVTSQPDWATLVVHYRGPWIDHQALLRYVVSFRNHADFHENCVERIFVDIKEYCAPSALTVYARYTRRGGLDINPFRSDFEVSAPNIRLSRQ